MSVTVCVCVCVCVCVSLSCITKFVQYVCGCVLMFPLCVQQMCILCWAVLCCVTLIYTALVMATLSQPVQRALMVLFSHSSYKVRFYEQIKAVKNKSS